jgi:hypothetical protein
MTDLLACDLDDYSRLAVGLALKRYPSWQAYASVEPNPDVGGLCVKFEIPCPSPAVEHGLYVPTADNELTVGFHTDHCHFTDYETALNPKEIHAGLDYAVEFLRDRRGVVSWYQGARLVHTTTVRLPWNRPLPRLLSECTKGTLRCWSGKFDRDEVSG